MFYDIICPLKGDVIMYMNSHFLQLFNDNEFAYMYFHDKDINGYTSDKLDELKRNVISSELRYKKILSLFHTITSFNNDDLLPRVRGAMECDYVFYASYLNDLNTFEDDLAYLIISNMINIKTISQLGFSNEYINELISKYNDLLSYNNTKNNLSIGKVIRG